MIVTRVVLSMCTMYTPCSTAVFVVRLCGLVMSMNRNEFLALQVFVGENLLVITSETNAYRAYVV